MTTPIGSSAAPDPDEPTAEIAAPPAPSAAAGAPTTDTDAEIAASRTGVAVSNRVLVVFVVRVSVALIGLVNAFVLARLLGPEGKGDFYVAQVIPATIFTLGQLGLSSAVSYYSGRGTIFGLTRMAVLLGLVLSGIGVVVTLLALPLLEQTFFRNIDPVILIASLALTPSLFLFSFANSILVGRQRIWAYGALAIGQVIAAVVLFVIFIGILGAGARGAVLSFFLFSTGAAIAAVILAGRATASARPEAKIHLRELFGYGLRLYPASLSGFFSYRADVYILALLLSSPVALGLYSVAVGFAELVFFLPDSVVIVFFPHVASGSREEADRGAPIVTRVTIAMTALASLALAPAAFVAVHLFLPAFEDGLPALFILLPAVITLSATKVLTSYLNGIGRTTFVSFTSTFSFILNVVMNFLLIPPLGIVGAASASLISYGTSAVLSLIFVQRLSKAPFRAFLIPTRGDIEMVIDRGRTLLGQILGRLVPGRRRERPST